MWQKKRERLQLQIDKFHLQAAQFWCPDSNDNPLHHSDPWVDNNLDGPDSEDEEEEVNIFQASPLEGRHPPEWQVLLLPSTLDLEAHKNQGYSIFVEHEKVLRMGQANDALQGLRLALSRKAIIFRQGVRNATTKTKKLRSWDQIQMVDVNVRHHARVYHRCRAAMIQLGVTEEILSRYRKLEPEHLNVRTARIDPALQGQRDASLAWFWTMDVKKDMEDGEGMEECEMVNSFQLVMD